MQPMKIVIVYLKCLENASAFLQNQMLNHL